ncbi:nucleoside 2-deoxyribosyltransferase [Cytobacillus oceanisediminis]|uniref:nucleoside 2-deoxyribosyltransferase n=1 Tax=Cytobacillus oceanisediminis TaxID=665099 RepID=UPI00203FC095|nr:nucleoside 2-deoxyribosyltransferase [Cytobacillus oceanisediminis]MCM3402832.1 nucleoside 2-deoxyribosyltransferase [Cytobacillus oceanisediminis]
MKFYIASSFKNIDKVRYVSKKLKDKGFIHTYDWTINENVKALKDLKTIGQKEKNAVIEADFVIVLLPAGKGSHIELGIAIGHGKKIYLYSPNNEVDNLETTSTFYHLPNIEKCFGTIDELLDIIDIKSKSLLN